MAPRTTPRIAGRSFPGRSLPALAAAGAVVAAAAGAVGCGGADKQAQMAKAADEQKKNWPADDRTLCDWKSRKDVEVVYSSGPGAFLPNTRRVYHVAGEKDAKRLSLVCREVDTNLDGVKDWMRTFNAKGEPQQEVADTDYDGKVDVWISFVGGHVSEQQEDTNHDGRPDLWRYYSDGVVTRVKRDRNFDGKPDVWEIYVKGHLERMGIDETFDGQVDRWDRDTEVSALAESSESRETKGDAGAPQAGEGARGSGAPAGEAAPPAEKAPPAEPKKGPKKPKGR